MKDIHIQDITAYTEITPDGQRCTAAILTYSAAIDPASLRPDAFAVEDRTITAVYTSPACDVWPNAPGPCVVVRLDAGDAAATTLHTVAGQPRPVILPPVLRVIQRKPLTGVDGGIVAAWGEPRQSEAVLNYPVDDFAACRYADPETGFSLGYRLYRPAIAPGQRAGLVLFLHGGGEKGDDNLCPIANSQGAAIWATREQQAEFPCFVLAPQCPDTSDWVDPDTYAPKDSIGAVYRLLLEVVAKNPVDTGKIFSTSLSMGSMGVWELNASHPNLFAAMLIAVGQSNHERMGVLKHKPMWAWNAENDDKAADGLAEIMNTIELAGGKVIRETIDASLPVERLEAYAEASLQQAGNIRHTQYFEGTLRESWAHFGWKQVYENPVVRRWLTGFRNEAYDPRAAETPVPMRWLPERLDMGDAERVSALSAGGRHSLLLGESGTLYGFGCNICGQLAMPKLARRTVEDVPVVMPADAGIRKACAANNFTAVLLRDGRVLACGSNSRGQLGRASEPNTSRLEPVEGLRDIVDIGVGGSYLLALDKDGFVWGVGDNSNGQLVDGTYLRHSAPVRLAGLADVTAIHVGMRSAFFTLQDGMLLACGNGEYGQLGNGFAGHGPAALGLSRVLAGPEESLHTDFLQIAPGRCFTLGLSAQGQVFAWGHNTHGELGLGHFESKLYPTEIPGLTDIVEILAGMNHALALDKAGRVWSWGYNAGMGAGVLGHGDLEMRNIPAKIEGIPPIRHLAAGYSHNLLLDEHSSVWGFGNAANGRIL